MKQFYMLFFALTIGMSAFAQLPDGSIAPDFTATDINGVEYNLYTLLDAGNTVILDFYATWCGPCWSYHETHILRDFYNTFGPEGTGDVYVFSLESDDATNDDDLHGIGSNTQGDWVTGTPYPMFDNVANIFDLYTNTYYPTIYTVCPDHTLTESGQATFDEHVAFAFASCSNSITGPAPMMVYSGETSSCGGGNWMASTDLSNLGSVDVLTATFNVTLNGVAQPDVLWTGVLSTGGLEVIDLGTYTETGAMDITLSLVNGAAWSANEVVEVVGSTESTSYVQVRITTDNWPEETSWDITDSNGSFIDGVQEGDLDGQPDTDLTWDVGLPGLGCYTFTIYDGYGDGLFASQWGDYTNGSASVVSMDGLDEVDVVWSYSGDTEIQFTSIIGGLEVTSVSGITENDLTASVNVYPNPFTDNTSLSFTSASAGNASVVVYNLIGEKIINMDLGRIPAGTQRLDLDFSSMEAGVYLISVTAGGESSTLRATLTH